MASTIENNLLQAIDTLITSRVSNLKFDKTVRATISKVIDKGLGQYKVKYQDSSISAYASDSNTRYRVGDQVYLRLPSDRTTVTQIIGKVSKLGTQYLDVVTLEDRITKVGSNMFKTSEPIEFCSYSDAQETKLNYTIDNDNLVLNRAGQTNFILGMTVKTDLPVGQQDGGGNYGIIVNARYYDEQYTNKSTDHLVTRTYVLDVNNMLGQPYKFTLPKEQYAIFEIDGDNLYDIESVFAFCKDFPVTKDNQPNDIFLSNFYLYFAEPVDADALSNASLKILSPNGNYITSDNDDMKYLEAELKIKGKKINLTTEKVDFYWFIKDSSVTEENNKYYNKYGGAGWRCINVNSSTYNNVTIWLPDGYKYYIKPPLVPCRTSIFKCVALYDDIQLNAELKFYHSLSYVGTQVILHSSAGTAFYFNTGKTTISCQVKNSKYTNFTYYWGRRTLDGTFTPIDNNRDSIDVTIKESLQMVTYECTVYSDDNYIGSGICTLINDKTQNITVIIKGGSKVFKYDEQGRSPFNDINDNKPTLQALSFDVIGPEGGSLVTEGMSQADVINTFDPTWVWPDEDYTLLTHQFTLVDELVTSPSTNGKILRKVLKGSASLAYNIANRYDIDKTDNNIRLQITYGGKVYSASTNFVFLKNGQNGSNGTKYLAKIDINQNNIDDIFIQNGAIWGYKKTTTKQYNANTGVTNTIDGYTFTRINDSYPLKVRFLDGSEGPLYDIPNSIDKLGDAKIKWSTVNLKYDRAGSHPNLTIDQNGSITPAGAAAHAATIIKVELQTKYQGLSGYKKYYASKPIDTSISVNAGIHPIVEAGYRECMYESDGTRSSFNGKPFKFRLFSGNNQLSIDQSQIQWIPIWGGVQDTKHIQTGNDVEIDPPSMFDSTSVNNYILVQYKDYTVIVTIYLYLNRFGMAAMNDWDGTSIDINENDGYILSPQVGAGQKDSNNRFTGVVMGKTFYSNSRQIGLFGFAEGQRSFFLDANTGKASFGVAGKGQIVIDPKSGGKIYSWGYSQGGSGMMINLEDPSITFGTGNFSVDKSGHLIAKGGGSIAGWKISDNALSKNNLYLDSQNSCIKYGSTTSMPQGNYYGSLNSFYLGKDGISIGDSFKVSVGATASAHIRGDLLAGDLFVHNSQISYYDRSYIDFDENRNYLRLYYGGNWNNTSGTVIIGNNLVQMSLSGHIGEDGRGDDILYMNGSQGQWHHSTKLFIHAPQIYFGPAKLYIKDIYVTPYNTAIGNQAGQVVYTLNGLKQQVDTNTENIGKNTKAISTLDQKVDRQLKKAIADKQRAEQERDLAKAAQQRAEAEAASLRAALQAALSAPRPSGGK